MKLLFSFSVIIILLFPSISCTERAKKIDNKQPIAFFNTGFGGFSQRDSIIIKAIFSECGEWGGHVETIIVNIDKERKFYATYKVYPFNCDSLDYYYGNESLKPIATQKTFLSDNGQQSIIDYIQRLTQSKITESFPGHAGNVFSIIKSDSTFFIQVYDTKEYDVKSFRQLVTELY